MAFPTGWISRRPITLNGSTDGELTNHQTEPLNVPWEEGMRIDFGDVRFTEDTSGTTEIPYHLINYTEGVSAIFILKPTTIPADPDVLNVYMWFDNPSATTTSNPENVYEYYDSGATDKSSEYTLVDINNASINASFTYDPANKYYKLKNITADDTVFAKINSFDDKANLKLKADIYRYSNTGNDQGGLIGRQKAIKTMVIGEYRRGAIYRLELSEMLDGVYTTKDQDSYTFPQNQWFTVELIINGTSAILNWYNNSGILIHAETTSTIDASIDSGSWGLFGGYTVNSERFFKNIIVMKTTPNPPTWGEWGEKVDLIVHRFFRGKLRIVEETIRRFRSHLWIEPERVRFRTRLEIYKRSEARFRVKIKIKELNPKLTQIRRYFRAKIQTQQIEKERFRAELRINSGETRIELMANVVLKRSEFDITNPQFEFSIGGERYDS